MSSIHSSPDIIFLGNNQAFVPDGSILTAQASTVFYDITPVEDTVYVQTVVATHQVTLCRPECQVQVSTGPYQWIFEKVDGGINVTWASPIKVYR